MIVNVFVTDKETVYVLKIRDNKYSITEKLTVIDDVSFYDFMVTGEDEDVYSFSYSGDFNKQTEIIKDIKYFKSGDTACIFPIYKREKIGDVSCVYDNNQVSYSYLKQINNSDIDVITNRLKEDGYKSDNWNRDISSKESLVKDGRGIDVYKNNIPVDYTFLMWRYKGLYILNNKEQVIKDYLEYDHYDNQLSALVGRYYVSAVKNDKSDRIEELVYYNTKEFGKGTIPLLEATSGEYYFNGVYKNKLYMTDVDKGKQFSIDPTYEKVEEVGNKNSYFVNVVDGELKEVKANEFLKEKVYFDNYIDNEDIIKRYGEDVEIVKVRKFYYFRTSAGEVYRSHEDNVLKTELLFKFDNLNEWKVVNGDILVVAGDTMYFYNDLYGLMPIAVNSELKYNHHNICDFWKK